MQVVHADEALVVVCKPAGLLAVPGLGERGREHLLGCVQRAFPDAQVAHRLDQATSGLMVFARGAAVRRALGIAFERREVHKRYIAVVRGLLAGDDGEVEAPLAADWPHRPRQVVDLVRGRPSLTRWRVLARDPDAGTSRVELEPVTGRSHQLRVHMQWIGHAIVGDALYGAAAAVDTGSQRLLLHASALSLRHPVDGQRSDWHSAAPF